MRQVKQKLKKYTTFKLFVRKSSFLHLPKIIQIFSFREKQIIKVLIFFELIAPAFAVYELC